MPASKIIEVSFVVLNWRKPKLTQRAVEAIRHQSGVRAEVIIVDNEEKADDVKQLRELSDHYIGNTKNLGFAVACNQGAAIARGKYIAFINNDAILPKDWVGKALSFIDKHQDATAVAGGESAPDGSQYSISFVSPYTAMVRQSRTTIQDPVRVPYAYGSNLLITSSAFKSVGGFEDSYFAYYEDVDLGAKLLARGLESWYVPELSIRHEVGASTGSGPSEFRNNLVQRNKYRLIARHYSYWLWWVMIAVTYDFGKWVIGNAAILVKPSNKATKRSVYRAQRRAAVWAILNIRLLVNARHESRANYSPKYRAWLKAFRTSY